MKRYILILAAFFTFSTSLISCREEVETDEVELEETMDEDIETTNDDLNGTTRGGNMEPETEEETTNY